MRHLLIALVLGGVAAAPLCALSEEQLYGTWKPDVNAVIEQMMKNPQFAGITPEQFEPIVAQIKTQMGNILVTLSKGMMTTTGSQAGDEQRGFTFVSTGDKTGVVTPTASATSTPGDIKPADIELVTADQFTMKFASPEGEKMVMVMDRVVAAAASATAAKKP